jgi:hypothetical protein
MTHGWQSKNLLRTLHCETSTVSGVSSDSHTNKGGDTQSLDLKTRAVLTEKQLVLAKKPDGHSETIVVLAFYPFSIITFLYVVRAIRGKYWRYMWYIR